ncbi:MAG TPA: ketol-acid reductoisomerase [Candidatus Obscuribacterales bacterium]
MTKMYWESDANSNGLKGKTVAVLGYGSQGRAHALNLRDSGVNVTVGLRSGGKTWRQAEEDGFRPVDPATAVKGADVVAMLTPDMAQPAQYRDAVEPNVKDGATLMFAHGFNVHFKQIVPRKDMDVVMIAPKGPGRLVRTQYEEGRGVPCLVAVYQDATGHALETALAYANGLGGTRAGVIETTFAEETETDLFGEQAVLCGGVTELIAAGWQTLVDAGYQPEVAYFECLHELKLIVDLIYEGGFARMHEFVSETAKFGDLTRGPRIVDDHVRESMRVVLAEVRDGSFAREWIDENKGNRERYRRLLDEDLNHPIEVVGKKLRANMSWLASGKKDGNKAPVGAAR